MEINGKVGNSIPAVSNTPEPMVTKFGVSDEVGDSYSCTKFHYDPIRGFWSSPPHSHARTKWLFFGGEQGSGDAEPIFTIIRQLTSFRARICLFGVPKT